MKAIGGYFELELRRNQNPLFDFNSGSYYAVNTCRNALLLLLMARNIKRIYIPKYSCKVIINSLQTNNIQFEYYSIDQNLEISHFQNDPDIPLIYTNYFGLKSNYIRHLSKRFAHLIIDNAHAIYDAPVNDLDTIYSPRKFFGMPDGGILFTNCRLNLEKYKTDVSYKRWSHLLKRIEFSPEVGYKDFLANEDLLNGLPIMQMSNTTKAFFDQIDFESIKIQRIKNFQFLKNSLDPLNLLNLNYNEPYVPLAYPLLLKKGHIIRNQLIKERIFLPVYWKEVLDQVNKSDFEYELVNNLLIIPVDQRYDLTDMNIILDKIMQYV